MAIRGSSQLAVVRQPRMGRAIRRPQHPFNIRHKPWVIQPFFIAPVLAGETLKNLTLSVRAVTDPIKNRFIGWWLEHYIFYVKLSDLDIWEGQLERMLLDPSWDPSGVDATTDRVTEYFEAGAGTGKLNFVRACHQRVVDEYFRDEGEAFDTAGTLINSEQILAQVNGSSVLNSVMNEADLTWGDVDVDANADGNVTIGEIDSARAQYEFLQQGGAVDMSYEDYLRMFGVTPPASVRAKQRRPELVRFARNWQYPVSAINETTGAAVSAVSWAISERADKDRFFSEPGFLFGVQVARPKVYMRNQRGTFTAEMNDALLWLPSVLSDDPRTSMKLIADNDGPLGDVTDVNGYWVDIKDLFIHGEQFTNYALATGAGDGSVALPRAGLTNIDKKYVVEADIDDQFVSGSSDQVRCDGLVTLNIASRLRDTSN